MRRSTGKVNTMSKATKRNAVAPVTITQDAPTLEVIAGGTDTAPVPAMPAVEPVLGSNAPAKLDMVAERAAIDKLKADFLGNLSTASDMARKYVMFGNDTANYDLVRHLYESVPAAYQRALARWACHVAPIELRRKTQENAQGQKFITVSFGKDAKRAGDGLRVLDHAAFDTDFHKWQAPKRKQASPDAIKLYSKLLATMEKLENAAGEGAKVYHDAEFLAKSTTLLHNARIELSKLIAKGGDGHAVEVIEQEQAVRDRVATTPTVDTPNSTEG